MFSGLDEQTLSVLQQLVGGQGPQQRPHSPTAAAAGLPSTPLAPPSTPSAYQLPTMTNLPHIRTAHDARQHQHQQPHAHHGGSYPSSPSRGGHGYQRQHRMRPHSPAQHGYHAQPNTPLTPTSPRKHNPAAAHGAGHDVQQPDMLLQLLQGLSSTPGSPLASPSAATPGAINHANSAFNRLLAAGNAGMDAGSLMAALQVRRLAAAGCSGARCRQGCRPASGGARCRCCSGPA
jgi:hypothetical protein